MQCSEWPQPFGSRLMIGVYDNRRRGTIVEYGLGQMDQVDGFWKAAVGRGLVADFKEILESEMA